MTNVSTLCISLLIILSLVDISQFHPVSTISPSFPTWTNNATIANTRISDLHRAADVPEFFVDPTTEEVLRPILPEIKTAVAERISSYTVFIDEEHVFNLLWAIPKLRFFAISYKVEVSKGSGMLYYVKYKVGYQCFQVKVFKNLDGDAKVVDVIGAIDCSFPVIFF